MSQTERLQVSIFSYFSQPKAWIAAKILVIVLTTLNRKLSSKGNLFMDNAGCHPEDSVKDWFSLPPNTTFKLQPLDLGIIVVSYSVPAVHSFPD